MENDKLPHELLIKVFQFLDPSRAVWPCALVCRHWAHPARKVLFQRVYLRGPGCLLKFHDSLYSSSQPTAGALVRTLTLAKADWTASADPLLLSRLLANCLVHTNHLEDLTFHIHASSMCSNLVVQRICLLLPELKSLTILEASDVRGGAFFDSQLLLDLPKTLQSLYIRDPSQSLIQDLPEILANLHRPHSATFSSHMTHSGFDPGAKERLKSTTGIKSLGLYLRPVSPQLQPHVAKIASSLTTTLRSLQFQADPQFDELVLVEFLSATPFLWDLALCDINYSLLFFTHLQPLIHLRSLTMQIHRANSPDWLEISPSFGTFISLSPQLRALTVYGDEHDKRPVSPLIDAIIASTPSKLWTICLRNFDPASADSLKLLIQSVPLLQYLEIGLPKGSVASVIGALCRLKVVINS